MSAPTDAVEGVGCIARAARRVESGVGTVVRSPVFPGAIAVSKGVVSLTLLEAALDPVLFAIGFLAAVTVYGHNRLTDAEEDAVNRPEQAALAARHPRALGVVAGGSYLLALGLSLLGGVVALLVVLLPGLAAVAYSEPLLPVTEYDRLKEIPVVNTAVTAGAWALPLAYLPVAFTGSLAGTTPIVVCAFLALRTGLAAEVMNVRDVAGDRREGIVTVPVALGVPRTRRVLYGLDAVSVAVLLGAAVGGAVPAVAAAALLPAVAYSAALTSRLDSDTGGRLAAAKDGEYVLMACCLLAV